jgi:hypothetical protein
MGVGETVLSVLFTEIKRIGIRFRAVYETIGLKEIGCKSVWLVYISSLFRPIEQLLAFKIVKIYPHPVTFSLRFFKSDRLLDEIRHRRGCEISVNKPWLELYYSQPQREAYDRTGVFS